jgi:hypothetical protein
VGNADEINHPPKAIGGNHVAGSRLTIKLTDDQQKQIKDATGKNITELNLDAAAITELSESDLSFVSGGWTITKAVN